MKTINFLVRVLVFGGALLLGTTAVVASRFIFTTIVDAVKTPVAAEKPAPFEELTTVPEFDQPEVIDDQDMPSSFDPSGGYSLDMEIVPKTFADIEYLEIVTHEYLEENESYISRPIVPTGMLKTKKSFAFTKILVGNREISFETESIDGIRYQFVGVFPESNEMINCEACEYPPDLKGQLKKIKNGRVVAEWHAKFYVQGC